MFARMTIREKLTATIATLLVLIALLGSFAISRMEALHGEVQKVTAKWLPSLNAVGAMRDAMNQHRQHATVLVMTTDRGRIGTVAAGLPPLLAALNSERQHYEALISSPEERQSYDAFSEALAVYLQGMEEVASLAAIGNRNAGRLFDGQVIPAYQRALTAFAELTRISLAGSEAAANGADESYSSGSTAVLSLLGVAMIVGLGLGYLIHRGIGRDLEAIARPMQRLAEGDVSAEVPNLAVRTEMGGFARGLQVFKDAMIAKRDADAAAKAAVDAEARARRGQTLESLVTSFEAEARQMLSGVAAAVQHLDRVSGSMTETALQTEKQAGAVANSAASASVSVQTVASAAEELGASIAEVARQITETAKMSRSAAEDARATDTSVTGLADAAQRIGDVVKLISDIAGQTNLLALNATIESARAGEHGKGFAVVASEVKQLAAQTSDATGQIAKQIAAMQAETKKAVEAIRGIAATVGRVDSITVQVAAAAEQQSSATQEIIRAVIGATTGTQEVTQITGDLTRGASATGAAAAEVRSSSADLGQRAAALKSSVDQFLMGVRAA